MAAPTAPSTSSSLVTSAGMTTALRPTASMSEAVSARPSALRATSATSAPASANATAMAWPMPREAPVTNAFLPVSSNRLMGSPLHSVGQRPGGRVDPAHDLVQRDPHVALPHPQVLGALGRHHLGLRHPGEPGPGLVGPQVVVELRDQGQQRACPRPPSRPGRRPRPGAAAATAGSRPPRPGRCPSAGPARCRTTSPPASGPAAPRSTAKSIAAATSCRSASPVAELALAGAPLRGRAPGVEPQHGQAGQRGQPVGRPCAGCGCPSSRPPWAAGAGR